MPLVSAFVATPTFTQIPGATPTTHPPAARVSSTGQLYINGVDGKVWVSVENTGPPNPATGKVEPPFLWRQLGVDQAPPWDPAANYRAGDIVFRPGVGGAPSQLYRAKVAIGPNQPPPEANAAHWDPIGGASTTPNVTTSAVAGETPTAPGTTTVPAPAEGDLFINTVDHLTWAYDGTAWVQLPAASEIGIVPDVAALPTANVRVGDLYYTSNEATMWLAGALGQPITWLPIGGSDVTVTRSATTGDTPAGAVFANPPGDGDMFINTTDRLSWVYGPTGPGAAGWIPLSPSAPSVYISTTAHVVPFPPPHAPGETQYPFPPGTVLQEGDQFINRVDHTAYTYGPDPATPGAMAWTLIPAANTAFVTTNAKHVPANAVAGETNFQWPQPPKVGDILVNTASMRAWVLTETLGGNQPEWTEFPGGAPAAWHIGTSDPPDALGKVGDYFLDTANHAVAQKGLDGHWHALGTGPGLDQFVGGLSVLQIEQVLATAATAGHTFVGRAVPVGPGTPAQFDTWIVTPAVVGAVAGMPGDPGEWLPTGATAPATLAEAQAFGPMAIPPTAWMTGQFMLLADGTTEVHWNGTAWVPGRA